MRSGSHSAQSSPKRKPWGGGGGSAGSVRGGSTRGGATTSEALREETARVETLFTKLKAEKERVRQLSVAAGFGVNGVRREGSGPHWPHSAGPIRGGTKGLLGARRQGGGLAALADLTLNGGNGGGGDAASPGSPGGKWCEDGGRGGVKGKSASLSPTRLMALAAAAVAGTALTGATSSGRGGGRGSGFAAVAAAQRGTTNTHMPPPLPLLSPPLVSTWGVGEVGDWLESLGLGVYSPVFEKHALTGDALLDISTSDLDYLGVTPLGHRKAILNGVGALRQQQQSRASLLSPPLQASPSSSPGKKSTPLVHWSHIPPSVQRSGSGGGEGGYGASLLEGEVDEEAEREAFKAAVMAWRGTAGGSTTRSPPPPTTTSLTVNLGGGGAWVNPFSDSTEDTGGGGGGGGGGSLLNGTFDEEAEAKAFALAVEEWRRGSGGKGPNSSTTPSSKQGGGKGGKRAACWQCLRAFVVVEGSEFSPPPDPPALIAHTFCSSKCHSIAALQILAREEALLAARRGGRGGTREEEGGGGDLSVGLLDFDITAAALTAGETLGDESSSGDTGGDSGGDGSDSGGVCGRVALDVVGEEPGLIVSQAEEAANALLSGKRGTAAK